MIMKLYRKLIRPMHSYPGPDYSPRVMPIENEIKWYPEEERECLEKKYASYNEGSFSDLVFEEKFEEQKTSGAWKFVCRNPSYSPFDGSPTELYRCTNCKYTTGFMTKYCPICVSKNQP